MSDLAPPPPDVVGNPPSGHPGVPSETDETVSPLLMADGDTRQLVGFQLNDRAFAFPIEQTREIVVLGTITPAPGADPSIVGVANLRGAIIPIVDLHHLLRLDPPTRRGPHAVVIQRGGRDVGCLVDSVQRVIRLPTRSIQPALEPSDRNGGSAPVRSPDADGVLGYVEHDDTMLVVLDAEGLLRHL